MSDRGTAYQDPSPGQFVQIANAMTAALPAALRTVHAERGIDTKGAIKWTTANGERLSLALAEAIRMLYDGHVATIPRDQKKKVAIFEVGFIDLEMENFARYVKIHSEQNVSWGFDEEGSRAYIFCTGSERDVSRAENSVRMLRSTSRVKVYLAGEAQ